MDLYTIMSSMEVITWLWDFYLLPRDFCLYLSNDGSCSPGHHNHRIKERDS